MAKEKSYREKLGYPAYVDPGIDCSKDENITEQHHEADCNINKVFAKYGSVEALDALGLRRKGVYVDVSQVPDYVEAHMQVKRANDAFMALPGEVRREFDNDPAKLFQFVQDPKNYDKALKLGLLDPEKAKKRTAGKETLPDGKPDPKGPAAPPTT